MNIQFLRCFRLENGGRGNNRLEFARECKRMWVWHARYLSEKGRKCRPFYKNKKKPPISILESSYFEN